MRLPKLVLKAEAIAAACPSCAQPLANVLVQTAPLQHPKSEAGAEADAATGPTYLRPSNLLLEALVRLPKLDSGAGSSAAARPSCAQPLANVLVQGAPLRHPKSVAGSGADAASGLHTSAQPAWRLRPWCAYQSLFQELGPLQLISLFVHTLCLASWCRGPHCAILNQLLALELMLLPDFIPPPNQPDV